MGAILIIDDDPQMGALLRQTLVMEGLENVLVAESGRQAMELFENNAVDVIVTDILMPDMDGMEVILNIRLGKDPTPIIAISGGGRFNRAGEVLSWATNLGIKDTFAKPIDRALFVARVRELLPK